MKPQVLALLLLQKALGQCQAISGAAPNLPEGFCQTTCGRCTCPPGSSSATSSPATSPPSNPQSPPSLPSSPPVTTSVTIPTTSTPTSTPTPCSCTDTQPDGKYTCAQQKAFGQCSAKFVTEQGHCQTTCGQCKCDPTCTCDDVQPSGSFTCAQQVCYCLPHLYNVEKHFVCSQLPQRHLLASVDIHH